MAVELQLLVAALVALGDHLNEILIGAAEDGGPVLKKEEVSYWKKPSQAEYLIEASMAR